MNKYLCLIVLCTINLNGMSKLKSFISKQSSSSSSEDMPKKREIKLSALEKNLVAKAKKGWPPAELSKKIDQLDQAGLLSNSVQEIKDVVGSILIINERKWIRNISAACLNGKWFNSRPCDSLFRLCSAHGVPFQKIGINIAVIEEYFNQDVECLQKQITDEWCMESLLKKSITQKNGEKVNKVLDDYYKENIGEFELIRSEIVSLAREKAEQSTNIYSPAISILTMVLEFGATEHRKKSEKIYQMILR